MDIVTILLTGVGAPGTAGTIYALKSNLDGKRFRIVGVDADDNTTGKYLVDAFHCVPLPHIPGYLFKLMQIIERENIQVVLPQTTKETELLAKYKSDFDRAQVPVVVSSYESIDIANDKFDLLQAAQNIGIPCPKTVLVSSLSELVETVSVLGYPRKKIVIKPRRSNGMRGLRILVERAWDSRRFFAEKPDGTEISLNNLLDIFKPDEKLQLLVSEYLPGKEYTVDVFRDRNGCLAIPRRREKIRSGITFDAKIEYHTDLISHSKKLADALDLNYCFGFQFKLGEDGVPKLLECNPRVQGTMVVSAFAGFNVIYNAVKSALGLPVEIKRDGLTRDGLEFKRYWGGLAVYQGGKIAQI